MRRTLQELAFRKWFVICPTQIVDRGTWETHPSIVGWIDGGYNFPPLPLSVRFVGFTKNCFLELHKNTSTQELLACNALVCSISGCNPVVSHFKHTTTNTTRTRKCIVGDCGEIKAGEIDLARLAKIDTAIVQKQNVLLVMGVRYI